MGVKDMGTGLKKKKEIFWLFYRTSQAEKKPFRGGGGD